MQLSPQNSLNATDPCCLYSDDVSTAERGLIVVEVLEVEALNGLAGAARAWMRAPWCAEHREALRRALERCDEIFDGGGKWAEQGRTRRMKTSAYAPLIGLYRALYFKRQQVRAKMSVDLVCVVCGAKFVSRNRNHSACSEACKRKREAARMAARRAMGLGRATDDERLRDYCRPSWGLGYDPYATGALPSDAMHCPVM